nr:uncharacterized protein LOC109174707 [Ipomoea batatas]
MTSRRISGFDTTPTYVGEEPSVFTIKLHIGGDLVWHPTTGYKDGGVEYFDHFNCHEGSLLDLRRMVKQLRFCDKKVQFWVLVKGKGRKNSRKHELKPLINDADIVNLVGDVPPNKELDIFVEHLFDDQWDYDVNPDAGLDCDEVQEVDCELSEEVLRSLENSDASDGELNVLENVFQESDLKKEGFKFVIGMIFKSADEFKWAVKYHEATRRKDIHFIKNEGRRGTDMDEVIAGESDVGIEDQFEDIAVETQVPTFVLEEMELMNSQPSQVVLNQGPPMSSFISSQMPTGSSNPSVITRSGKNYHEGSKGKRKAKGAFTGDFRAVALQQHVIPLTALTVSAMYRRRRPGNLGPEVSSCRGDWKYS